MRAWLAGKRHGLPELLVELLESGAVGAEGGVRDASAGNSSDSTVGRNGGQVQPQDSL